ncbi:hypothetical protein ES705_39285 [subsurface metagenome]
MSTITAKTAVYNSFIPLSPRGIPASEKKTKNASVIDTDSLISPRRRVPPRNKYMKINVAKKEGTFKYWISNPIKKPAIIPIIRQINITIIGC